MKKIRIGIVGYGNLGKAVEKLCMASENFELVAIFSHRNVKSEFNNDIYNINNISKYINRIDILIMCGGSYKDIPKETLSILKNFNVINSFDTHKSIYSEISKANKIAKKFNKLALYSFGWDPGLFSLIRAMLSQISTEQVHTTWGKGVSMGHSNALKEIDGVLNARSYTIPIKSSVRKMRKNKTQKLQIIRKCYVVKKSSASKENIIKNIKLNKTYFGDCKLQVKFISEQTFENKHNKIFHEGEVFSNFKIFDDKFETSFKVKMTSNALFTAKILLMYALKFKQIKQYLGAGAYTILDLPMSKVINLSKKELIKLYC